MVWQRIPRLFAVLTALAMGVFGSGPASAADPSVGPSPECWVQDTSTGEVGADLRGAIRDASSGALLRVRGMCTGGFHVSRDITLVGPATLSGQTCVDGNCFGHIAVSVTGGNVKFKNLVVTGGESTHNGAGIYNQANLTLSSTSVRGNVAEDGGGGIYNEGRVIMNWSSSVSDNQVLFGEGGGISNHGTLIMNGRSTVEHNGALYAGGGIFNRGTVVLNRMATVTANQAEASGGIFNDGGSIWFSPRWNGTLCGNTPDDWPRC